MDIFAVFDEAGVCQGLYDMTLADYALPAGSIRISAEQREKFATEGAFWRWDHDAGHEKAWLPPDPDLVPPNAIALAPWRTGLRYWQREGGGTRFEEVSERVKALVADTNMAKRNLGILAQEQLEYASNVQLSQLVTLMGAFGFTETECIESMFRARQVERGDLSGVWPLPAARA